tara:strand:+ start:108 stop:380 length:273 start_codon:yes stop_codon:yes gene_type:complete
MTEKKLESSPTTKKLKSILKMLQEAGVASYRDSEVEIVFGPPPEDAHPAKQFNFDSYDSDKPAAENDVGNTESDDLGFTEEDYLYRSAGQ